jgi:hypothetical protein
MRYLAEFVAGLVFGWMIVTLVLSHRRRTLRYRSMDDCCRCGHERRHHYGDTYCRVDAYDRTGQEPECPCGVFTPWFAEA